MSYANGRMFSSSSGFVRMNMQESSGSETVALWARERSCARLVLRTVFNIFQHLPLAAQAIVVGLQQADFSSKSCP